MWQRSAVQRSSREGRQQSETDTQTRRRAVTALWLGTLTHLVRSKGKCAQKGKLEKRAIQYRRESSSLIGAGPGGGECGKRRGGGAEQGRAVQPEDAEGGMQPANRAVGLGR